MAVASSLAMGQSPAIGERRAIHKGFGVAAKHPSAMLRGEARFELAVVQEALRLFAEGAPKLKRLYPDDSRAGGGTKALPEIWHKMPEFLAIYDKFGQDAVAATEAIHDEASFRAEFPRVMLNCGVCHRKFMSR